MPLRRSSKAVLARDPSTPRSRNYTPPDTLYLLLLQRQPRTAKDVKVSSYNVADHKERFQIRGRSISSIRHLFNITAWRPARGRCERNADPHPVCAARAGTSRHDGYVGLDPKTAVCPCSTAEALSTLRVKLKPTTQSSVVLATEAAFASALEPEVSYLVVWHNDPCLSVHPLGRFQRVGPAASGETGSV